MRHKHRWKKTGNCHYTCPLEYEYKCTICGKINWVEDPSTGIEKLSWRESIKRHPELYPPDAISLTEKEFKKKYPQYWA
jgi:hypothetical protein